MLEIRNNAKSLVTSHNNAKSLVTSHNNAITNYFLLLAIFYNKSLSERNVLERFKSAVVTPLLKKEGLDHDDLRNFRPIFNDSLLSKMLSG